MGEVREFTKRSRVRSRRMMNKRHYKSWRSFWEKTASSQASSDFEDLGVNQQWAYSRNGEQRVAVSDHELERDTEGHETSYRIQETYGVAAPSAGIGAGSSNDPPLGDRRSRRDGGDSGPPGPSRRRRRDASPGSDATNGSARKRRRTERDVEGQRTGGRTHASAPSVAPSRSSHASRTAAQRPAAESDDDSIAGGPESALVLATPDAAARRGGGGGGAPSEPTTASTPTAMTPVEFIQEKTRTRRMVDLLLADGRGPRSVKSRIEAAMSKLSESDLAQMDQSPQSTLEDLTSSDSKLAAATQSLESARLQQWPALAEQVATMTTYVETARAHGELQLKALNFIMDQQRKTVRAMKNSERYKINRKVTKMSRNGGVPKLVAKLVASRLDDYTHPAGMALNPESFDPAVPTLWTAPPLQPTSAASGSGERPGVPMHPCRTPARTRPASNRTGPCSRTSPMSMAKWPP